jgi:hypothetical protein
MLKTLFALILISIPYPAMANNWFQTDKPVLCGPVKEMFKQLVEDYKEEPIWLGTTGKESSKYSLFVNSKTGAWTIVQSSTETACILGTGLNSKNIIKSTI